MADRERNLLIVGHFSPSVGYAWDTIREYFLALGRMFRDFGFGTRICYPRIDAVPDTFRAAGIGVVELDFMKQNLTDLYRFVRKNRISVLYLTDAPVFSVRYLICRLAGVKKIVVHDRTSGERDIPGRVKGYVKKILKKVELNNQKTINKYSKQ